MWTLQDADKFWKGESDALKRARIAAREQRMLGSKLSAHSMMLSAYISVASKSPIRSGLLGLWHALWLLHNWRLLNHNELDVLISFLVRLAKSKYLPSIVSQRKLHNMAWRELDLCREEQAKPHQYALGYITLAEVSSLARLCSEFDITMAISNALSYEKAVREEPDQPQGLRQLVRIFRKAGELYKKIDSPVKGKEYLYKALQLASAEADAPDQAHKIAKLLEKLYS